VEQAAAPLLVAVEDLVGLMSYQGWLFERDAQGEWLQLPVMLGWAAQGQQQQPGCVEGGGQLCAWAPAAADPVHPLAAHQVVVHHLSLLLLLLQPASALEPGQGSCP
jgi:hypothetical protein